MLLDAAYTSSVEIPTWLVTSLLVFTLGGIAYLIKLLVALDKSQAIMQSQLDALIKRLNAYDLSAMRADIERISNESNNLGRGHRTNRRRIDSLWSAAAVLAAKADVPLNEPHEE